MDQVVIAQPRETIGRRVGAAARRGVTFKERYQVSRKYAIPLMEYLDRERVTRRAGETRHIL